MAIDEQTIINMAVDGKVALKIAEKALELAQNAMIELQILKATQSKVEAVNPYTAIFGNDIKSEEMKEPEVPEKPMKLSPFNIDLAGTAARASGNQKAMTKEEQEKQEIWDMSVGE